MDPIIIVGIIAVLAIVGVIGFLLTRRTQKGDSLVLVGLSDSGKTLLFEQFVHGKYRETYPSMKPNEEKKSITTKSGKQNVHIVDVPGHERLRPQALQFIPIARALAFVIDISTWEDPKNVRQTAQYLYELISNEKIFRKALPTAVVCTKSDLTNSISIEKIESDLAKEIDILRQARKLVPDQTKEDDGSSMIEVPIGNPKIPFTFAQLPQSVQFLKISSLRAEGTKPLLEWLEEVFS